jgi:hypothetical protein
MPKELALRLGNEGVAGSADHVDGAHPVQAIGHCREGLNAADREDRVSARCSHRMEHRRVDANALPRRRVCDHPSHAGHLRHEHGHEGRREQRHAAAGHVRADGVDGDVAVPEHHARHRLVLERREHRELGAGEALNLLLRERDRGE